MTTRHHTLSLIKFGFRPMGPATTRNHRDNSCWAVTQTTYLLRASGVGVYTHTRFRSSHTFAPALHPRYRSSSLPLSHVCTQSTNFSSLADTPDIAFRSVFVYLLFCQLFFAHIHHRLLSFPHLLQSVSDQRLLSTLNHSTQTTY